MLMLPVFTTKRMSVDFHFHSIDPRNQVILLEMSSLRDLQEMQGSLHQELLGMCVKWEITSKRVWMTYCIPIDDVQSEMICRFGMEERFPKKSDASCILQSQLLPIF
uniref:Uncharacterized protein n=1 Tax=Opuntia streptacantha TaxID=393608 RepID=A0A7C8YJP4_OPUST